MRIQEEDFPNLRPQALEFLGGVINIGRLRGTTYDFAKIAEILYRGETLPLEDDLAFEIMNLIERMAVAEGSLFKIRRTFLPRFVLRFFWFFFHDLCWLCSSYAPKSTAPERGRQGRIEVYTESQGFGTRINKRSRGLRR